LRLSNIPNAICVVRILLVFPIVLTLLSGSYPMALVLMFVAGVSDGLDGFLAKRFNWSSRIGGLLDPVADKMLLVAVFLTLAWVGLVPVWLAAVVILRDLIIVGGAFAYQRFIGNVDPDPSIVSKINTALQLLYVVIVVSNKAFFWPQDLVLLLVGSAVLVFNLVSGLDYVLTWSKRALRAKAA
jgi:cardiolipin synthase